jgi:hypothetical protein
LLSFATHPLQSKAFNHIMSNTTTKLIIYGVKDLRISSNGRVESEVMKDEQPKNSRHLHIQYGCQWKKEQRLIENCIKIIRWTNGNAI